MNGPHLLFRDLLKKHTEWIAVFEDGRVFSLRTHEMELGEGSFGHLDRDGYRYWKIERIGVEGDRIRLHLSRRFGADVSTLELIPRMSAEEAVAAVRESRLARANEISEAVASSIPGSKIRRISTGGKNSRFCKALFDQGGRRRGLIADVTGSVNAERLLTAAVLWLHRASDSGRDTLQDVCVVAGKGMIAGLKRLHACLSPATASKITIVSLRHGDTGGLTVSQVRPSHISDLWKEKAPRFNPFTGKTYCETSDEIFRMAPDDIDRVYSMNGTTIRFRGLPFARIRQLHGRTGIWIGVERNRKVAADPLGESHDIVRGLNEYRRHDSPNKQHLFYQAAPEAWLESLLRKNIKALDPNLQLSPVYNQFRASRDRIDLLAVTRGGRIVIIEVKVAKDPAMVLQAVDYWRRIELLRQKGLLGKANLFGNRDLADLPAMIYLAAPSLCFGPEAKVMTGALSESIGLSCFLLNEDWKRRIKVVSVQ